MVAVAGAMAEAAVTVVDAMVVASAVGDVTAVAAAVVNTVAMAAVVVNTAAMAGRSTPRGRRPTTGC